MSLIFRGYFIFEHELFFTFLIGTIIAIIVACLVLAGMIVWGGSSKRLVATLMCTNLLY